MLPVEQTAAPPRAPKRRRADELPTLMVPRWVDEHVLAHIAMLRNRGVKFARLVAGLMNARLEDYTRDLTEGLGVLLEAHAQNIDDFMHQITAPRPRMRARTLFGAEARVGAEGDAEEDESFSSDDGTDEEDDDSAVSGGDAPPAPPTAPSTPMRGGGGALPTKTRTPSEAANTTIALALHALGVLGDAATRYLDDAVEARRDRRAARRSREVLDLLSLPQHIGTIFYSDRLAAGIAAAYSDVVSMAGRSDLTYGDLMTGDDEIMVTHFARLVAANMRIIAAKTPRRFTSPDALANEIRDRDALVRWFRMHENAAPAALRGAPYDALASGRNAAFAVMRGRGDPYRALAGGDEWP